MQVSKVLNNNVIVSTDTYGTELVIMGRGIGFQQKVGSYVLEEKIEKIFTLKDKQVSDKFQQILADIKMEHAIIAEEVIDYAEKSFGRKFSDSIYVTLTDHISSAIHRYEQNIKLTNPLFLDIKRIYRDEFLIGEKAVEIMKEKTGLDILEDEASFIAYHFVNAELNTDMCGIHKITTIVEEISGIVRRHLSSDYNKDSIHYYRFITNLKYIAQKIVNNEGGDDISDLYEIIKEKYPEPIKIADQVKEFVSLKYNYEISLDELAYLSINISRIKHKLTLTYPQ